VVLFAMIFLNVGKHRTKTELNKLFSCFSVSYIANFNYLLNLLKALTFSHEKTAITH